MGKIVNGISSITFIWTENSKTEFKNIAEIIVVVFSSVIIKFCYSTTYILTYASISGF